ncbi:MAG TPA: hypothetical protein VFE53_13955 [Mucilaginibacter sp.]|jgi:hypothetical protein|nr:hypothetical protein [Mucilaginibacter sp.]
MSKGRRPKVRKSVSPEDSLKPDPGSYRDDSPKSGEENSTISIPQSEITNSAIDISRSDLIKSEIVNRKSEIEMEVHHHPDLHHQPKPWKEYLLEGLMIFIAVMMGFFAESIREHITDNDHEKQSIESLVKAAASDTVQLHDVISQATGSIKAINSLMGLKNADLTQAGNKQKFYLFSLAGFSNDTYFRSNDGALQQLNSSGTLRLISNRGTVDSIFKYELLNKNIAAQEADDYFVFKEMLTTMAKVQDLTIFQDSSALRKQVVGASGVQYTFTGNTLPAISGDKDLMKAYFNYASLYMATKSVYNYRLQKHLDYSRRLIVYLKTAYNIK